MCDRPDYPLNMREFALYIENKYGPVPNYGITDEQVAVASYRLLHSDYFSTAEDILATIERQSKLGEDEFDF